MTWPHWIPAPTLLQLINLRGRTSNGGLTQRHLRSLVLLGSWHIAVAEASISVRQHLKSQRSSEKRCRHTWTHKHVQTFEINLGTLGLNCIRGNINPRFINLDYYIIYHLDSLGVYPKIMTNPIKFLLTWASPLLINPIDWGSMNPGLSCRFTQHRHRVPISAWSCGEAKSFGRGKEYLICDLSLSHQILMHTIIIYDIIW